jgi:hypothetical protein
MMLGISSDVLREIGAYAGLAALPGVVVLAALCRSQRRDVARLVAWAQRDR